MFGQSFAFANPVLSTDPVTLGYLNSYAVNLLSPNVQISGAWSMVSTNIGGTNHLWFNGYSVTAMDLASVIQYVRIDSIALDATKTNVVLNIAVSNYIAGSFIETTTNLAAPQIWTTVTNYNSGTNSGEISFTNQIVTVTGAQFWRARGNAKTTVTVTPALGLAGGVWSAGSDLPVSIGAGTSGNFTNTTSLNLAVQVDSGFTYQLFKNGITIHTPLTGDCYTILKPGSYLTWSGAGVNIYTNAW
jgi:hypothetical protein